MKPKEAEGKNITKEIERGALKKVSKVFIDLYCYGFCDTKEDRQEFSDAEIKIGKIIERALYDLNQKLKD